MAAGYDVSAICPKGPGDPKYQEIDGVRIYKYKPAPATRGVLSYVWEFAYSWLRTAILSVRAARRSRFKVIQACNPPDTYWALARLWRLSGVRFVYDQHDLNPEVFRSRFGEPQGAAGRFQYKALLWLERRTYRAANEVISTNESYRQTAVVRGGCDPDHVTVVRSGPDTGVMRPVEPDPALRKGRRHLAVYLGIMGPQDGVDLVIRALDHYVNVLGRTDLHVALLGFGDCLEDLQQSAHERTLDDYVTFTGRADAETIAAYLSTAAVGIQPDPLNPLNDVSTMNKTMEYMTFGVPVVAFDLVETRVSAADTALYIPPVPALDQEGGNGQSGQPDARAFAEAIAALLDDPERRVEMAEAGRSRVETDLDWREQARAYVGVFDRLTGTTRPSAGDDEPMDVSSPDDQVRFGRRLIDLATRGELGRSVLRRSGYPE